MWRRKYLSDDEIVVQNIVITPGPWISASRAVPPAGMIMKSSLPPVVSLLEICNSLLDLRNGSRDGESRLSREDCPAATETANKPTKSARMNFIAMIS